MNRRHGGPPASLARRSLTPGFPARRAAAAVGSALVALGLLLTSALPAAAESTTIPGPDGPIELSVSPARKLPVTDAEITVRGAGFDPDGELWVAICQDDGVAPQSMNHCLGGAIPDANGSSAWGVVTADGSAPYPGPVSAKWRGNGSFQLTLQVAVGAGQDADCFSASCSVYTRSADGSDSRFDAAIPIRFKQPPATPTVAPPSTATVGGSGGEATTESISAASLAPGEEQQVVFAGFTAGEAVDVTLYSDPIPLPPTQADAAGAVTVTFTVPEDLPLGEHLVQVVGRQSGVTGVASFTVVAPAVTTDATSATTADTAAQTADTAVTEQSEVATPLDTEPTVAESTAPESAEETSAEAATESTSETVPAEAGTGSPASSGGSTGLLWLWVVLGVLLLAGIAALVIALRRRGQYADYDDLPPVQHIDEVLDGPGIGVDEGLAPLSPSWSEVSAPSAWPIGADDPRPWPPQQPDVPGIGAAGQYPSDPFPGSGQGTYPGSGTGSDPGPYPEAGPEPGRHRSR